MMTDKLGSLIMDWNRVMDHEKEVSSTDSGISWDWNIV